MKSEIKRYAIYTVALFLLTSVLAFSQTVSKRRLKSDFVLEKNRAAYLRALDERITEQFGETPPKINVKKWRKLFYELSVDLYKTPSVKKALRFTFAKIDSVPAALTIDAILAARALYPAELQPEAEKLFEKTKRVETAVYAFHYLYFANREKFRPMLDSLAARFGEEKPLVKLTEKFVTEKKIFPNEKQLREIFSPDFLRGELVIYTILRADRKIPGLTVIRKPNGEFLRRGDSLFAIRQLAYSVTDFPYYLKNGNTPQGIYLFDNFYQSKKKSIGPTPVPIIRLPFEVPAKKFARRAERQKWSKDFYASFLPEVLRTDDSFFESYYAGKLGRKLLVMHGSTDNPALYENESYFPLTPSTGCLTSFEKWDEKTGRLLESDQLKLVNAILSTGKRRGYLFVFEINDALAPVKKDEILRIMEKPQLSKK